MKESTNCIVSIIELEKNTKHEMKSRITHMVIYEGLEHIPRVGEIIELNANTSEIFYAEVHKIVHTLSDKTVERKQQIDVFIIKKDIDLWKF